MNRRIHSKLKKIGIAVSEKVVRRIIKAEKLTIPAKRIKKYNSYRGEITPEVANLLDRGFYADLHNL